MVQPEGDHCLYLLQYEALAPKMGSRDHPEVLEGVLKDAETW